jgi:hypothetical protein
MPLGSTFFDPFDSVYRSVTSVMTSRVSDLVSPNERDWLVTLITAFQTERDAWLSNAALEPYRTECERLRVRVAQLVAAIYLHVSFDLARVLGNNWPETGRWSGGPLEAQAEHIYFALRSVFADVLKTTAGRRDVTGIYCFVLRLVPLRFIGVLNHWVWHLREGAWRHGRTLATRGTFDRGNTEQRMLRAMSAALRDVTNLPWSFVLPAPPNVPPPATTAAAYVFVLLALVDPTVASGILLAGVLIVGAVLIFWIVQKSEEMARFIDAFGSRVDRYMHLAIYEPENFERMLSGSSERGLSAI